MPHDDPPDRTSDQEQPGLRGQSSVGREPLCSAFAGNRSVTGGMGGVFVGRVGLSGGPYSHMG